ncbi:MAG TPA: ribosome assembly cofactor RimP [Lentimicrobium sp.]|nr:ribosome assembly cofactor RimP [Lentimicrobium sp.]
MINGDLLNKTVEEFLQSTDIFVVDIKVKAGNKITILLDKDNGNITIDDCIKLNRKIESAFDRDVEDYELMVSSAGVGQPLKLLRQYIKIIGKEVDIEYTDKTVAKGTLIAADSEKITVKFVSKVKKEIVEQLKEIPFSQLKSVKEVISFK